MRAAIKVGQAGLSDETIQALITERTAAKRAREEASAPDARPCKLAEVAAQ